MAIVVPALLLHLAPRTHTAALALLTTCVLAVGALTPPLAGILSDRARRRGGDRRRETALALLVDVLALAGMAFAASVGQLGVALIAATIALTAAQTIYQALLPEIVPRSAWGTAAGVRGAMTLIGTVLGLACAALLPPQQALLVTALAIALVGTTLAAIPHAPPSAPPPAHARVRDRHDLGVMLVARGWIVLGMTLLGTYVLYFFSDVLGVTNASLGTGLVAGATLLGAIVSSIWTGTLSDKVDRRIVVALSGVPMTLAALGFALFPDRHWIFLYAALFGLGYGGVFSVGWALALDAIPEIGDVARDLGVWGTLSSLPSIVAPGIGAWIIAHGATPALGYRWMFALAGASFAIGSLTVLRVGRRPVSSLGSTLLVALTTAIRQPLITAHVRVRQWGRLPFRRGATVLIANHQHEDESEIVVERTFAQGPWRAAYTASSRRMYEPGFFATRMPWLGFMRGVNAGPLFLALGMLPLENELAARPLRSLAHAVRAQHGDLPLELVFRDEARPVIPAGARTLADVLLPQHFAAGETRVRLSYVLEPYRRELLTALRAQIDADVAHIVDVVRRGATFFVTPEGFYSTDGRMRPLKGIVEHLVRVATPWFAAIAFDPFRGRRLSMLYRVVQPADPHDLATSLAAARPVTTSALLATWLLAVGLPFDVREAVDGVTRLRDALPPGAFVDPELARDAERCVAEAVDRLAQRGTLARAGARYLLGELRTDARFPGVADVVAYQAAFVGETIAALQRLRAAAAERAPALR
jgi:MFS family permease